MESSLIVANKENKMCISDQLQVITVNYEGNEVTAFLKGIPYYITLNFRLAINVV
jgi:hypothetical protein